MKNNKQHFTLELTENQALSLVTELKELIESKEKLSLDNGSKERLNSIKEIESVISHYFVTKILIPRSESIIEPVKLTSDPEEPMPVFYSTRCPSCDNIVYGAHACPGKDYYILYNLELLDFGKSKVEVAKILRKFIPNLSLQSSLDIINNLPRIIFKEQLTNNFDGILPLLDECEAEYKIHEIKVKIKSFNYL